MTLIKIWMALLAVLISQTGTLFALSSDANVWKAQTQQTNKQDQLEVVYENYSDNMLPLISRDLTLLGQAVELIRNDECRYQCKSMLDGIRNLTSWAVRFYDSSGKFPEGVLGGSFYQLGNFDECLQIGQADDGPPGIYGQYCLGEVAIGVPDLYLKENGTIWEDFRLSPVRNRERITKLHWGICVPAACESHDVEGVVRTVLAVAFSGSLLQLTPRIPERSCYKITPPTYNNLDIAYTCVILTLSILLIVGTTFHLIYLTKNKNVPGGRLPQLLLGFSIISNLTKLCGENRTYGINLSCISGVKVIAMVMIIAGHSLIFVISGPVLNIHFWEHEVTKVGNAILINNPLLVDTFLLLSGFLVSFLILHELNKGRSINFFFVYIQRYLRLTPAYLIVILLYMTWFPRMDSGPMWSRVYLERDRCFESWWANLLYINNYVNTDKLCMFQSWYLSVDTQLFMLAPLLIYPLHKWHKIGELILGGVTIASVMIPFVVTLRNESDPTLMVHSAELKDISTNHYFIENYIKTHMRASAYCFGLTCGYIVHRMQLTDRKLSPNIVRFGWLLASISLIASMSTIVVFYGDRINYTPIEAASYAALHRVFWSLGTGWVIIACITGNGGIVAKLLEWKGFSPISRLTYSAYLMNGMVELYEVAVTRTPRHLDYFSLVRHIFADVIVTFICALLLSMTCESPILGLEKMLLTQGSRTTKRDKKDGSGETNSTEA